VASEQSQASGHILLIEDNEGDIVLALDILGSSAIGSRVHVTRDGVDALRFLQREGKHQDAPRPDLILLDLNLPRMHGLEVLERLKADAELSAIPVVVFSSSDSEADVNSSYEAHANCYITKPSNLDGYVDALNQVERFWFKTARLPSS